jgi:hypothetical protein
MKVVGSPVVPRRTARAAVGRRVENINGSGKLGEDSFRQPVQPPGFVERRRSQRASRFDTRFYCDAERSGTPLGFVAQVLGQVLNAGRNSPIAAARVYARANASQKKTRLVGVL